MKIETNVITVNQGVEKVFSLISDLNNYKVLFPEEKIKNWESSSDSCSFLIKGMSAIQMDIKKRNENDSVEIVSGKTAPFKFNIKIQLEASQEQVNLTALQLTFDADVNPFMKMMVEKPLTNFFNSMVEQVPNHL